MVTQRATANVEAKAQQALRDIDQTALSQMLCIMVVQLTQLEYIRELSAAQSAREILDDGGYRGGTRSFLSSAHGHRTLKTKHRGPFSSLLSLIKFITSPSWANRCSAKTLYKAQLSHNRMRSMLELYFFKLC